MDIDESVLQTQNFLVFHDTALALSCFRDLTYIDQLTIELSEALEVIEATEAPEVIKVF
jgi:hypothetical protein